MLSPLFWIPNWRQRRSLEKCAARGLFGMALALVALAAPPIHGAALLVTEGFQNTDYPSQIVLGRSPFIAGFTGSWVGSAPSTQLGSGSLLVSGYTNPPGESAITAGNRCLLVNGNTRMGRMLYAGGDGPLRNFAANGRIGSSQDGSSLFIAFVARMSGTSSLGSLSLFEGGLANEQRRLRIAWLADEVVVAAGESGASASLGPRSTGVDLFVLEVSFTPGSHSVRAWRNPSLSGAQPAADAVIDGEFTFDRLGFTFSGSGSLEVDEIRFADAWEAATDANLVASYVPFPPVADPIAAAQPSPSSDGMETFPPSPRPDGLYDEGFYPFIDAFGQYKHLNWADKVHHETELTSRLEDELAEMVALQPPGFSQYGGWRHGPRVEPTGFFRTVKLGNGWWLVDPEGYLFFSSGVTTVASVVRTDASGAASMKTGISGREHFFGGLPPPGDPARTLGLLANETATVTSGDYQGQRPLAANFFAINALRQFPGAASSEESLRATTSALAFERLQSWGFNTISGWSDPDLFVRPGRRPYTHVLIYTHPGLINGVVTWLDYFRDQFAINLRARLQQELGTTIGDPWNLGFYIDNERDWTKSNVSARDLGLATLASPPETLERYAKQAFRDQLQAKYSTITALNNQWGVNYASWDDFISRRDVVPGATASAEDMTAFESLYAETYFRTCLEIMREVAPQHLYLGNRFTTGGRDPLVKLAGQYADVLTVNIYGSTVNSTFLSRLGPDGPVMSTEFHFWSRDTGLFSAAVSSSSVRNTQADRAAAMKGYISSAIDHSRFVGTHWFQYFDYPTSGRLNSRNMNSNLGLVATTNLPYRDMVAAAREVNYGMYRARFNPPKRQPQADAHASASAPGTNYGSATTLSVGPGSEAFLRFSLHDVSSVIERAILLLHPVSGSSLATHFLTEADASPWTDDSVTWNSRPAADGPEMARWSTRPGLAVEIDVTASLRRALLGDRRIGFRIQSADGTTLHYGSREAATELRPQLLLITSPATLAAWRERYFLPDSPAAADTASPNGDGVPNLLKYALGLGPFDSAAHPGWKAGVDDLGRVTLTFQRARADLTYVVEASADLITWTALATNPGTVGTAVTVTDPATAANARFLRLRVSTP